MAQPVWIERTAFPTATRRVKHTYILYAGYPPHVDRPMAKHTVERDSDWDPNHAGMEGDVGVASLASWAKRGGFDIVAYPQGAAARRSVERLVRARNADRRVEVEHEVTKGVSA